MYVSWIKPYAMAVQMLPHKDLWQWKVIPKQATFDLLNDDETLTGTSFPRKLCILNTPLFNLFQIQQAFTTRCHTLLLLYFQTVYADELIINEVNLYLFVLHTR